MIARESLWRAGISAMLRRITSGSLVVMDGDVQRVYGAGQPVGTVTVRSPRFWPMLRSGSLGLADAYAEGLWETPDPVAVIRVAARNGAVVDRARRLLAPPLLALGYGRAIVRRNTRRRSREDIASHYDLGDELFSSMLDPTMSYSCAIFEHDGMTLEEASVAKFERVCEKLDLAPDDRVLEIGTGWGGFAMHAAATRGCHVTTTTISAEQHAYAVRRIADAGLSSHVTVLQEDYRDLRGTYDKLVSIEMIEAVGWQHLGTFFSKCSALLAPHGAMLLQAITVDDRAYELEKACRTFIRTRIFPGGCLPSLEVIARHVATDTDMRIAHLEELTEDYVRTLRCWRENFNAAEQALAELGYDERFRRMWELYLAYCEAGFAERRIGDVQIVLAKPRAANPTWRETGADVRHAQLVTARAPDLARR
jgi:cyclopropane-fatty-acyl-phospholipid synthase